MEPVVVLLWEMFFVELNVSKKMIFKKVPTQRPTKIKLTDRCSLGGKNGKEPWGFCEAGFHSSSRH